MKRWFRVQSIGTVERPGADESTEDQFLDPWEPSTIVIDSRWEPALAGIEGFSHLVVLFYLDRKPRARTAGTEEPAERAEGLEPVGMFATRSPKRPNPIGIACPELISREGNRLLIRGIDAWDNTPVIDIKGYYPPDELRPDATVPLWLSELWTRHQVERKR